MVARFTLRAVGNSFCIQSLRSQAVEKRFLKATVSFMLTVEGGRKVPPHLSGYRYRPGIREANASSKVMTGAFFYSGPETFSLGESVEATFLVLAWPDPSCHWLDVGAEFEICEGTRKVGSGIVTGAWVSVDEE